MSILTPTLSSEYLNFIDGQWVPSRNGQWIEVESPRNFEIIAQVPRGDEKDIDDAVAAARRAFPAWRDTAPRARGRLLQQIGDVLEENVERIARIISAENGNAIKTQARGEVRYAVDVFRYFGSLASEAKGEQLPLNAHVLDYSRREPIGVVGAIVPWNAPVQLAAMKVACALATGNTLVLKAAEDAPLAVLEMAKICADFIPAGVLNVIVGYGTEAGEALITHPDVGKISFTGSSAVGSRVMEAASDRIVPVSLELGGKNPQIVFPDADEDWVAQGVIAGMRFARQGQSCTAGSRLFVHRSIIDSFVPRLIEHLSKLKVGDPLHEDSDIGTIVSKKQFDRVCSYIEEGLQQSEAKVVLGGKPPVDGPLSEGYFVEPTVFVGVDNQWRIAQEEIFGPVLCVIPWEDEAEVIEMANDTSYGLSAFIWTNNLGSAIRTANAVEAGWVQVNQGGAQVLGQSYGGFKRSGIGREFSVEGMIEGFTQRKHISIDISH
ncbi:aldehyde dehydrogenase family protein [Mycolicibacterium goodii]|uniref:aldehyde dehydrogenase family protein n=1 Tax=Mycolicibacterium goodii TaxID=134601 RepID=UPI001BDBEF8E|nr:aldehyde dehydrogenase family protein [Mycolicibacterium goodii]MBU8817587.1 aldehyde dehydrogenase family protein [Mycolicibacterium goodii]